MKTWLIGNEQLALKNSYIWNMIASGINASEAILILMVAQRTVGVEVTGIFAIAFTTANLMMCIGKYGVRNFQATDTKREYSFKDYYCSRIITLLLMAAATVCYVWYAAIVNQYSLRKTILLLVVVIIYGIEAYEDVFLSGLQQKGRLDIGTKMFSLRWAGTLLIWSVLLSLFKNALIATIAACFVDLALVVWLTLLIKELVFDTKTEMVHANVIAIIKNCMPLCISMFLAIYLPNASKYAIDACLTDEMQAYYGFISMPIFVIDLLCVIIFQPILVTMSTQWNERRYKDFLKGITGLLLLILVVAVLCMVGAFLLGIPILSLLYATDLRIYKKEFMLLIIGGGALGYVGLFTSLLTIIRKQKYLMYSYVLLSVLAVLTLNHVVTTYGIFGAALENMMLLILLAMIMGMGTFIMIWKQIKRERDAHEI